MYIKNKWLRAILPLLAVASIILSGAGALATPGNVDGIGNVDLRDVIMSLQVVAGLNPDGVSTAGDSDGDGAVGLAEAIYGLQFVSGIRHVIFPESQSFDASGGTGGIGVSAANGFAWTAASEAEWISVTFGASGSGDGTVFYSVAENVATAARTGILTVAGRTFTVEQAGAPCVFAISPESQSFEPSGGTGGIDVTAGAGCAWTAESKAEWISVTSGASGSGNGTVSYTVAENTGPDSRTGTLTVASKTFTVDQAGAPCGFDTSPESQSFGPYGGTGGIAVTSAAGCEWTAASDAEWISVTYGASGSGNGTVLYSVAENPDLASRTGTLNVGGNTIRVEQDRSQYAISGQTGSFDRFGGTGSINVTTTPESIYVWNAAANVAWVTVTSGPTGQGDGTVSYWVEENASGASRTGTLTVAGKTFTVEQTSGYTNSLGMEFVRIPAGTFLMGSPAEEPGRDNRETQHQVTLTRDFYMMTTEVTQAQWEAVMGSNPSHFSDCGGDCPVDNVSWNEVQDFIAALNARDGRLYRLPTEAEWEYAARAGTTTAFHNGDTTDAHANMSCTPLEPNLDQIGWYCGNTAPPKTYPVAQKQPNDWGLYDMSGNVLEWCQDWFGSYPEGAVVDPAGPETGDERVLRGGSWWYPARGCRSAYRDFSPPSSRDYRFGFRLVFFGTFTNSLGMEFVRIPSGKFIMGSPKEEPGRDNDEIPHPVILTQDFYMMTTEVTQAQWEAVMGSNPSHWSDCGGDCPVEVVSWNDVHGFIAALNAMDGRTYRLPTEAEWEYAARAGTTTAFYNGEITNKYCDDANLDQIGWYCGTAAGKTYPVAQKQPNDWGLYDMSGNVWEWCQDWYGSYLDGAVTDPTGSDTGSDRVLRGGSWYDNARDCRSAYRLSYTPSDPKNIFGFRLALSPGP